jgi:predicted ATPase/class 3 adenylate cyclase
MAELPTGTVTFLFTDIEGSTRLLQELGDGYRAVHERHGAILRAAIRDNGGHEIRTEGDSFFAVFSSPTRGVGAAAEAQRSLADEHWPHGRPLKVRMGLHTGEAALAGGEYLGSDVHRAARIAAAGHGGQVLLSDATRALVEDGLPDGVRARDLGDHELKDFDAARHLFDLVMDGLPSDFPPIRSAGGPRRVELPAPRTSFVGRQRELDDIGDLLGRARLLTLTGPGGSGKTRLAQRAAADQVDRFEEGVVWVDLSDVVDPSLVLPAVAGALGVRSEASGDLFHALVEHVVDREVLLVVDNVEQVVDAAPDIGRLLDAAPRVKVLATSRVPLHLSGEHEYLVRPLPLPDPTRPELESLTTCESVMLFVERAAAVRGGFTITEDNAAAVAEITTRLDGLPLAIELAASRIKLLSPQALLERLERRLPILTGGARDLPERQRTLRSAIEWSHDLLEPEEQRLLARLAAFRGGWTLEAAEAVCGPEMGIDVVDVLASLVDKSLVRQHETPDGNVRFRMLETIHEFAAERLGASGEEDAVRRRHAEYVLDLAEAAEPHLMGEEQGRWLETLAREHDNVRAALDWSEAAGEAQTALRIGAAVWRFWQLRGHLPEGGSRLERILAMPGASARAISRARALGALGGIRYWLGDYSALEPVYQEAVDIAREIGDRRLLSRALFDLSFVPMVTTQDVDRQDELVAEASAAADPEDRTLIAQLLTHVGFSRMLRGADPGEGVDALDQAIAIHRELGDRILTAENLIARAGLQFLAGDADASRQGLLEAVAILAEPDSGTLLGMAVASLAVLESQPGGDPVRAAGLLGILSRLKDEGSGSPPEFVLTGFFGNAEELTKAAVGEEAFVRAHAEGYAMTGDQARAYVRAMVERVER